MGTKKSGQLNRCLKDQIIFKESLNTTLYHKDKKGKNPAYNSDNLV